ncbi:MAG: ABC transporter ATP-binding protein [Eubacteriales bacterium]
MARVVLRNVVKNFGDVRIVKNVNLEIEDKEFLVLVGPSGCGKSTTLRMVAGLEDLTSGEIIIGDRIVNDVHPKDRGIAMVFQNYALYPHMDVYENMAFGLKLAKMPKAEIDKRINEAAETLGITELLKRKPKELSGGQRQRVAVGRAIVREPDVLLMDEPLSNLDAKLRVQMRTELIKLHNRLKNTIIYVTHDQTEAMTMGTRIVVMKDGVIQQVAAPQEIYDKPVNVFVAGFIGSPTMNFINCRVISDDGKIMLDAGSFRLPAPAERFTLLEKHINKEVLMGIRPENVHVGENAAQTYGDSRVEALVEVVEQLGSEVLLYLKADRYSLTVRAQAGTGAATEESIPVFINMNKIHIFETETEAALF